MNSISSDSLLTSYEDVYSNNSTQTSSLQGKLSEDFSNATDEELLEVCKEFEAYFVEQTFKAMQKMIPESEDESSSSASTLDMFEDNLVQEYASMATEGEDLGLAQTLYEQMKRNYSI